MFFKNLCIFLIFIISSLCIAQNTTSYEEILNSKLTFEQKKNEIDFLINEYKIHHKDSLLERVTHKYAIWFYKNKKLKQAIKIAEYSQKLKEKRKPTDTLLLQHGLNNIGFFYYKNQQNEKSILLYQKSISLNSKSQYGVKAHSELGRCYNKTGDYYKALTYFGLAHSLLLKNRNFSEVIVNAVNAGEIYRRLNDHSSYKKGIKKLVIADSLSAIIHSKPTIRLKIKNSLGNLYNNLENINKSSFYYKESLNIAKSIKDSLAITKAYGNIGNLYNDIDPDLGIQYQKKAFKYITNDSIEYAIRYSNIGYCLIMKGKFNEGILYYQKAIGLYTGNSISESDTIVYSPEKLSQTSNKADLLIVLKDIAQAYRKQFNSTNNKSLLGKSITNFLLADELIDLMRIESQEFQSKLFWRKQSSELYGRAIEACFLAKDIDNAFYFMEKNKALLLTEDLINTKFKQSQQLPKDVVNRETQLQKTIYFLEKESKNNSNQKKLDAITIQLLNQKRNLKVLQDSIQHNFSGYTTFKIQSPINNLESVQKQLDDETVLLEYNISDYVDYGAITDDNYKPIYTGSKYGKKKYTKGYILCITKKESYFIQLRHPDQLKSDVRLFIKKASAPFKTKEDIISYQEIGYRVFDQLFPTKKIKELVQHKKVRIIPDNYLNYVPFEALVTNSTLKETPQYLLENCEISYVYSNSFLKNSSSNIKKVGDVSFVGFAPNNFDKYDLIPLENNTIEVANIQNYFPGEIAANQGASKKLFLKKLKDHNIIHLATHADATDSIAPWIAFSDSKLTLDELYLTKNQAELVVLSGCNTLKGKQETGEGVMSLARGFFHSGAKSVVSSLWNVDDRSTSYIMDQFYKNLKNNQSKSKALRDAKLSYLKNSSLSESSPHFWASFVLLGDSSPIKTSSFLYKYWLVFLIPLLLIFLIIYRKMKK